MSREYTVGYKKPPRSGRFKKRTSGNPKGRPKGSPNVKKALERLLKMEVTMRDGEVTRKVTALEALLLGLFSKGIKGHAQSARTLLNIIDSKFPEPEGGGEKTPVTTDDKAAVARFLDRHGVGVKRSTRRSRSKPSQSKSKE